ncbi:hypothetical protein DH2020_007267 [Rehmannia glutinosa]|uniref:C3H1-type domain-containing protein n=1 Tax=Rehmannia glutinosa TaxID=99300 RepID=A0ABR0TXK9_REHGL
MGERRKRKSSWDMEEDTNHLSGMSEHNSWSGKDHRSSHGSGRYHEVYEPRISATRKSKDHSEWTPWESIEENPIALMNSSFKNAPKGKEFGGGNRYYKNMSPGFNGMKPRNYDHTHEYDQSHSQSRSDIKAKDHTRSRSPVNVRQSYGRSDRRSDPEKSSQVCKDFSTGRCMRGNQCRFFHLDNISHRDGPDGDLVKDDTRESWRSRTDYNHVPKHSYSRASGFESRDDVFDPYHGEDEHFVNKSRNAVPCKDFVRGKCRWGDTCRFSHHAASNDSFGQAGKCNRENCRFSHEDPINVDGRQGEVTERRSYDKSNWWNGPTWDDATRTSDTLEPTGWGGTNITNTASINDVGNGQTDDRGSKPLPEQPRAVATRNHLSRHDAAAQCLPPPALSLSRSTAHRRGARLQQGEITKQTPFFCHGTSREEGAFPAANRCVGPGFIWCDDLTDTTTHPIIFFGQSLTQNGGSVFPEQSSITSESDRGQNMLLPKPSNGFCTDMNDPKTHIVDPLNVQTHTQNDQKTSESQPPGFLEAKVPQLLANLLTRKLSDQVTNFPVNTADEQVSPVAYPVSLSRSFVNEYSQTYAGVEVSNSREMMPSFSDTSGWAPLVNTSNVQPNPGTISHLLTSMGNGRDYAEHGTEIQLNNHLRQLRRGGATKDEKGMRLFKNALVEFVKEILKPTWKEGRMSREDHKNVVKKWLTKFPVQYK